MFFVAVLSMKIFYISFIRHPSCCITIMTNLDFNTDEIMGGSYGVGFRGRKAACTKEWLGRLDEAVTDLYKDALNRPGGAVGRGPQRHYVEIHPEDISGFADL